MTEKNSPGKMKADEIQILKDQPTKENPYIVESYPYGRLRTQARFYIETNKRYGQRFVKQTLNPKTNRWNKPKKSTYAQIKLAGLNEKNHITHISLSMYSSEEAKIFKEKYWEYLDDHQQKELINIIKMLEVYDKVEWKIEAQKYRDMRTGEITESVNIMEMHHYEQVKVDQDGNVIPVDEEKERKKQSDLNRRLNQTAVINAAKETSWNDALDTFKRG